MEVKQWIDVSQESQIKWFGDSTGIFSVKSAYISLKQIADRGLAESSDKSKLQNMADESTRESEDIHMENVL